MPDNEGTAREKQILMFRIRIRMTKSFQKLLTWNDQKHLKMLFAS